MKRSILGTAAAPAAIVLSLALAACSDANSSEDEAGDATGEATAAEEEIPALSGTLTGIGASSQQAAQDAWIAEYTSTRQPDVTVNYSPDGSGAGREQFLAGAADFAGSDSYLKDEELTAATEICGADGAVEFPVYVSPIAVPYNLPGVDDLQLSPATLAGIFAGTITTWDAAEIAADNPDATLPATAINPVHRADKSGTTGNFTDYLGDAAGEVWTAGSIEEWPAELGGEAADKTSGVITAVTGGEGSIGYADASQTTDLQVALIKVGEEYVGPTAEAAAAVLDVSTPVSGRAEGDIALDIARDTTESGVYPIVLVSYAITCATAADADQGALIADYLTYITSEEGQQIAADNAGSAPITDALREQILPIIEGITAGAAGAEASETAAS